MTRKKTKPKKLQPLVYEADRASVRDLDKALYTLLQIGFDLRLFSEKAFHHATTCETKLFGE